MSRKASTGRYEAGLEVRRAVLGDQYVDSAISKANDFTKPLQDLINEYCWGTVWTRSSIERKTRSFVNLGILTALNRPNEIKIHVKGALRNGCTKEEIQEVLLQATIYCGVPAGVEAFRVANEEVLAESHPDTSKKKDPQID